MPNQSEQLIIAAAAAGGIYLLTRKKPVSGGGEAVVSAGLEYLDLSAGGVAMGQNAVMGAATVSKEIGETVFIQAQFNVSANDHNGNNLSAWPWEVRIEAGQWNGTSIIDWNQLGMPLSGFRSQAGSTLGPFQTFQTSHGIPVDNTLIGAVFDVRASIWADTSDGQGQPTGIKQFFNEVVTPGAITITAPQQFASVGAGVSNLDLSQVLQ